MKTKLYMAYGSNLNLPQMANRCPTAKVVGTSEIKDYALLFRGHGNNAVATIEPKEGASVPVMIWDITPKDESSLDLYEGYPTFYEKEIMEVELNGQAVSVMGYVMTPGHPLGYPSNYYYNTIAEGYKTAGFDSKVLEEAVEYTKQLMSQEPKSEPKQEQETSFGSMKWW